MDETAFAQPAMHPAARRPATPRGRCWDVLARGMLRLPPARASSFVGTSPGFNTGHGKFARGKAGSVASRGVLPQAPKSPGNLAEEKYLIPARRGREAGYLGASRAGYSARQDWSLSARLNLLLPSVGPGARDFIDLEARTRDPSGRWPRAVQLDLLILGRSSGRASNLQRRLVRGSPGSDARGRLVETRSGEGPAGTGGWAGDPMRLPSWVVRRPPWHGQG